MYICTAYLLRYFLNTWGGGDTDSESSSGVYLDILAEAISLIIKADTGTATVGDSKVISESETAGGKESDNAPFGSDSIFTVRKFWTVL